MSTTSPQTDAPETSERCGHCARLIRVGAFESHWHGRCLSPAQLARTGDDGAHSDLPDPTCPKCQGDGELYARKEIT